MALNAEVLTSYKKIDEAYIDELLKLQRQLFLGSKQNLRCQRGERSVNDLVCNINGSMGCRCS